MDGNQYPDEEQYLARTVEFIDEEVRKLKDRSPETAAYTEAATELQKMNDETIDCYQMARPQPYFGRVDFLPEGGGNPIKGYIGKNHIQDHVFSWVSSYAKQLFYADLQLQVHSYQAPKGEIRGIITLKRQYTIENAHLVDVTEVYRLLPPKDPWD